MLLIVCTLLVLSNFLFLASCDKPKVVPESERVTSLMKSSSWNIQSVTVDAVSNTSFKNMTLVFTGTAYNTTNGGVVWPSSGTWAFTNETAKVIKRDDGVEVNIDAISETSMTLSIAWSKTTLGNGRGNSVKGKHIFTLKK